MSTERAALAGRCKALASYHAGKGEYNTAHALTEAARLVRGEASEGERLIRDMADHHAGRWSDQPDGYWLQRLMQEVGELASVLAGDHDDTVEHELAQIGSIALNWLRHRALASQPAPAPEGEPRDSVLPRMLLKLGTYEARYPDTVASVLDRLEENGADDEAHDVICALWHSNAVLRDRDRRLSERVVQQQDEIDRMVSSPASQGERERIETILSEFQRDYYASTWDYADRILALGRTLAMQGERERVAEAICGIVGRQIAQRHDGSSWDAEDWRQLRTGVLAALGRTPEPGGEG